MIIYFLELEIYTKQLENLQERNLHYSNVYTGFNKSKEIGIKWLKSKFEQLKSKYKYLKDTTLDELVKNNEIEYIFKITKIEDLKYAETFILPEYDYECRNLKPTHIVYRLKYNGEEIYHTLEFRKKLHDTGYAFMRYPGDQLVGAGSEFKVGDLVVLKEEPTERIFVVNAVPEKHNPKKFFVNEYKLSTLENGILNTEYKFYGGQLQNYDGEIDNDSPLIKLSKTYKENKAE